MDQKNQDFVNAMLEKAMRKDSTEPQKGLSEEEMRSVEKYAEELRKKLQE